MEDQNLFEGRLRETSSHMAIVHPAAEEDMRFAAGGPGQWDPVDYKKLKAENRPALSVDQVGPTIRAVSGSEHVNRFEAEFIPRNADLDDIDTLAAEAMGAVFKWSWQSKDAEHQVSRAYRDAVTTGYGWTETYLDFEENPDGQVRTDWVPQFEVGFDPAANHMNLGDAQYVIRGKWMQASDFAFMFPDAAKRGAISDIRGASRAQFPGGFMSRSGTIGEDYAETPGTSTGAFYDTTQDKVLVYEHQSFTRERQFRVTVPQGLQFPVGDEGKIIQPGRQWLAPDDLDDFMIGLEDALRLISPDDNSVAMGLKQVQSGIDFVPRKVYHQSFHSGGIELASGLAPIQDFTYLAITGFENQGDTSQMHWMGLVENMKDPQRMINSLISSIIWLIRQNPNALMYERNTFVDEDHALRNMNNPSANVELIEGALRDGRVKPRLDRNPLPSGMGDMLSFAMDSIPRVSGVNPFFSGMVADLKRTPAASVQSVQNQAMVILSVLMDSLRAYRKQHARISMKFIQQLRPEIVERVLTPELRQQGAGNLIYNTDITEYDIVIDESPTSASHQAELRRDLLQNGFLMELIRAGFPIPPDIFESMGLPSNVARQFGEAATLFWQQTLGQMQQPQQAPGTPGAAPVQ